MKTTREMLNRFKAGDVVRWRVGGERAEILWYEGGGFYEVRILGVAPRERFVHVDEIEADAPVAVPVAIVPYVEVDREECLGGDSIRLSRSIRVF